MPRLFTRRLPAIIDLVLPDRDGIEVCKAIREWSDMPLLVLSAVGDEAEKVRALEAGADDYVTKPFGPASWSRASVQPCGVSTVRRVSRS